MFLKAVSLKRDGFFICRKSHYPPIPLVPNAPITYSPNSLISQCPILPIRNRLAFLFVVVFCNTTLKCPVITTNLIFATKPGT